MRKLKIVPGIYENIDFETYLKIDALSNTRLGQLEQSPYHYKMNVGLDEKAKYLILGQLVHAGRLEVLSLAERYAVMPPFELDEDNQTTAGKRTESKATTYYKERVAEFVRVNSAKVVVSAEWFGEMQAIVRSLVACDEAYRLLTGGGHTELTLIWRDKAFKQLCKARMDHAAPSSGAFVDLKTTADLRTFPNAIARYGYHRQLAHYQAGWAALNRGELLEPWIIAAEKSPPYCVQCAPMDDDAISEGRAARNRLMDLLCRCQETNHWPPPESPRRWQLPQWAVAPVELTVSGEIIEV